MNHTLDITTANQIKNTSFDNGLSHKIIYSHNFVD